jgi:diketogulonate reductase-like aldo/keto reductase
VAVPLVCDQVLYLPYHNHSGLLEYCQRHEIALTAYSPVARGDILDDTLAAIGDPYDTTAAQFALRWLLYREHVVAIQKAPSREHLAANAAVFDVGLAAGKMRPVADAAPGLTARVYNLDPAVMRTNQF